MNFLTKKNNPIKDKMNLNFLLLHATHKRWSLLPHEEKNFYLVDKKIPFWETYISA